MKVTAFLIKYGEIAIKGKNRYMFEDALMKQIRHAMAPVGDFKVRKESGRMFVEAQDEFDYDEAVEALQRVFGIVGICPMVIEENKDMEHLTETVIKFIDEQYPVKDFTFKVHARRGDKQFPLDSMAINMEIGGQLLDAFEGIKVDVHHPQVMVNIEVRKYIYIYSQEIKGPGGMPVGTNGKAMLLLSGGIDSPVAGYMMARRGMAINALHFHSYPYTSENAKNKVIELAGIIKKYTGSIKLHIVSFTHIQEAIHKHCDGDFMITLMRRIMYRIAERLALQKGYQCIITGENLGQVASQTVESMTVTNAVVEKLPIFRPLISFDKEDISNIAVKIGTFDTSILPYEDCCTVFLPKHPVIKPKLEKCLKEESKLDIDALIDEAMSNIEVVEI